MKTALAVIVLLFAAVSETASAQDNAPYPPKQLRAIKTSITDNLKDRSVDIRESTLLLVMELKDTYKNIELDEIIVPLLSVLKSDEVPEIRILAACALYRFDSEIARYAVSRRALYDGNCRVARHCANVAHCWNKKADMGVIAAAIP
jgi:hypothetical protein